MGANRLTQDEAEQLREQQLAEARNSTPANLVAGGTSDQVPDGTVDEVKNWVGEDTNRAQRALDAENAKPHPRSSLVDHLEALTD